MTMPRPPWIPTVTIDTSVFRSALIHSKSPTSGSREVLRRMGRELTPTLSPALAEEIARKLLAAKMDAGAVADLLAEVAEMAEFARVVDHPLATCRDPNDRFVIALAIVTFSWCMVAQDKDLLAHCPHFRPPGWDPGEFLVRLRRLRCE